DPEGGRLRFWFDASILGENWFEDHLTEVKNSAGPRYTPELRIGTPVGEAFEAFGLTDEWFQSLGIRVKEIAKLLEEWGEAVSRTTNSFSGDAFPEPLRPDGARVYDLLHYLAEKYTRLADLKDITVDICELDKRTREALALFRELRVALAEDLDTRYGEGSA